MDFFSNLVYLLNNVTASKIVGKYWVLHPSPLGGHGVKPSTSLLFCLQYIIVQSLEHLIFTL